MVEILPVGLAAAPVDNQVSLLATYKESLCKAMCISSSIQPQVSVVYTHDTPVLNGTTVFVPIVATITIVTPGRGCNAKTQLYTERFVAAFQGQTALPTEVTITSVGQRKIGSSVRCGLMKSYTINDSLTISITPPAA